MQLLQVESYNVSNAQTNESEVAMEKELKKEDHRQPTQMASMPSTPTTPLTYELRKNGYLALARGSGSGVYDTGLSSQVSGGIEMFGLQKVDSIGEDTRGLRQSSIDTEPHTLATICVRHAKDGAVEIIRAYDEEEALHLFLKDAEDEQLREEALAAVLPVTAPELVT